MSQNNIEIYLNGEQVDIYADAKHAYEFESPVFKDIGKVMVNRTYSFQLPLTDHNRRIVGFCDLPDVSGAVPYSYLTYEERRGGLSFITGQAQIESMTDSSINMLVVWGNSLSFLTLKDLKMREVFLPSDTDVVTYLNWNNDAQFMSVDDNRNQGFLLADFGKGVCSDDKVDISKCVPMVNLLYILHLLEEHTHSRSKNNKGIRFSYPERFGNLFRRTWIPLTDQNASTITWNSNFRYEAFLPLVRTRKSLRWVLLSTEVSLGGFMQNTYVYSWQCPIAVVVGQSNFISGFEGSFTLKSTQRYSSDFYPSEIELGLVKFRYTTDSPKMIESQHFKVWLDDEGYAHCNTLGFNLQSEVENGYKVGLAISTKYNVLANDISFDEMEEWKILNFPDVVAGSFIKAFRRPIHVTFGDKFPIIANLPDVYAKDMLATIMNMFGLFAYSNYKTEEGLIQFFSIDDVYADGDDKGLTFRSKAVDWTYKLVKGTQSKGKVEFKFGDYEHYNYLRYAQEDNVRVFTEDSIKVMGILNYSKDLYTLPFAASMNISDGMQNSYALINLYGDDGIRQVKPRILLEGVYHDDNIDCKSAYFPDEFRYNGDNGLLSTYFTMYQRVLYKPYVRTCTVYLDDYDLLTFREIYPVIIDGIYYLPLRLTMQRGGVATAVLLRISVVA